MSKKKRQEQKKKEAEETAEIETRSTEKDGVDVEEEPESAVSDENTEPTVESQLQQEIETSREDARKNHELYLRAMADMENLRKRSQREKEDLAKFGNEMILREVLPVVDNLQRAVEHAIEDQVTDGLLEGVQMTLDQFAKVLEKFNVVPVEAIGQVFDPALHQAMGQIETEDYPVNVVAQEMQKGYLLNERLLRPSLVMIAKAPVVREEEAGSQDAQETE